MSVNPHDPRPQASIRTVAGTGTQEPTGPYVDKSITKRNIVQDAPPVSPPKSGSTTLGSVRGVYAEDGVTEIAKDASIDNSAAVAPPHSPNSWKIETIDGIPRSADPYRNSGLIGRDYLDNQNNNVSQG